MLWLALAAAITIRAARDHLPFALTWWSFTFPVGTVVTGTTALYRVTAAPGLRWISAGLYLLLLGAWLIHPGPDHHRRLVGPAPRSNTRSRTGPQKRTDADDGHPGGPTPTQPGGIISLISQVTTPSRDRFQEE